MIPTNDVELDAESIAVLEAIEVDALFADYLAKAEQLIKSHRDHVLRSRANRKAEVDASRKSGDWIHRKENAWSAVSDRELKARSYDERERARKARNKRDQRARKAKPATPAPAIASVPITREAFNDRLAKLKGWLALPGHRQRHLRGREADIMRAWVAYQNYVTQLGRRPNLAQFAATFIARFDRPMTRQMAQKRLKLLGTLMAAGGPLR